MDLSGPGIDVKLKERKKERKLLEKVLIFMMHGLQCRPTPAFSSSALPGYG
jgi:hypothetical protein